MTLTNTYSPYQNMPVRMTDMKVMGGDYSFLITYSIITVFRRWTGIMCLPLCGTLVSMSGTVLRCAGASLLSKSNTIINKYSYACNPYF